VKDLSKEIPVKQSDLVDPEEAKADQAAYAVYDGGAGSREN